MVKTKILKLHPAFKFFCQKTWPINKWSFMRTGCFESSMVCHVSWSGTKWIDIWSMERNGMAGKRSIYWFQVVFSACHPFSISGVIIFTYLAEHFSLVNRGAGFISLENLLFFAKTFSVRYLSGCPEMFE